MPHFQVILFAKSKLWYCPTFWWRDTTIYLVVPILTARPTYLLYLL